MKSVVVDASAASSWVLPGEDTRRVIELRDRAANKPGISLLVPPTFWYEVANALRVATRRERISPGKLLASYATFFLKNGIPIRLSV